jgi:hypothetical protein
MLAAHGDTTMNGTFFTKILVFLCLTPFLLAQDWNVQKQHGTFSGDLPNIIAQIAQEFDVPVLAELDYGKRKFTFPAGRHSAREAMEKISKFDNRNRFSVKDNVGLFINADAERSSKNLLNQVIKRFTLPKTVGELQLYLAPSLQAASKGLSGSAIAGVPSSGLSSLELPRQRLNEKTGREILLAALHAQPRFLFIAVVPKHESEPDTLARNWFWAELGSRSPIYVQPEKKIHKQKNSTQDSDGLVVGHSAMPWPSAHAR